MKLSLRTNQSIAELTIEVGNAKLTEDVLVYKKDVGWVVEDGLIENFVTLANDMSRFDKIPDVAFVKSIYDTFLNDTEKEEFLTLIQQP